MKRKRGNQRNAAIPAGTPGIFIGGQSYLELITLVLDMAEYCTGDGLPGFTAHIERNIAEIETALGPEHDGCCLRPVDPEYVAAQVGKYMQPLIMAENAAAAAPE